MVHRLHTKCRLTHGEETRVWGDQAYRGQSEVIRECAPPKQAEDRKKPNPSACTGLAEHLLPRRHGLIQSFPRFSRTSAWLGNSCCTNPSTCRALEYRRVALNAFALAKCQGKFSRVIGSVAFCEQNSKARSPCPATFRAWTNIS